MAHPPNYTEPAPEEYYDTLRTQDYYDKVHRATWSRRTAGFMAGVTLGVIAGAVIGAVAALLPPLLIAAEVAGAATVTASTLATIGTFAGLGGLMGFAALGLTGAAAGATAAGMEEKEKREKDDLLKICPPEARPALAAKLSDPLPTKEPVPKKLYSWKVAAMTIPLFAAFGALLAASGTLPAAAASVVLLGAGAKTMAATLTGGAVFGMFGALIGVKMSYITNKVTNFYFDLLTEKLFHKGREKSAEPFPVIDLPLAAQEQSLAIEHAPQPSFSERQTRFSVQGLIEQRDAGLTPPDVVPGR